MPLTGTGDRGAMVGRAATHFEPGDGGIVEDGLGARHCHCVTNFSLRSTKLTTFLVVDRLDLPCRVSVVVTPAGTCDDLT